MEHSRMVEPEEEQPLAAQAFKATLRQFKLLSGSVFLCSLMTIIIAAYLPTAAT